MGIVLEKGQNFKFEDVKNDFSLSEIKIGLGWDVNRRSGADFDLDASAVLMSSGRLTEKGDVVYFQNKEHSSRSVRSSGDNLTGNGNGDDEVITVKLQDIPSRIDEIAFVVNIYKAIERNQRFEFIENSYIRATDQTGKEIAKYTLHGDSFRGESAVLFGKLYRKDGSWRFKAVGESIRVGGNQVPDTLSPIMERFSQGF